MTQVPGNIRKLYLYSFLQMTLFPMAIITLFWKDRIGLSLTQILLLQSVLSVAMVVMEYPSGYVSDRIGYRTALTIASVLGIAGWGLYTVAGTFTEVLAAEILLGVSLAFISGSDSALLYESLKASGEEASYPRHQGKMSGYAQIGEAAGALCAGLLYARNPLLPFILQVGVWVLALAVARSVAEPQRQREEHRGHIAEAWHSARYAFVENRHLRATILLNSFLGLASFYPVWLIQPYMQRCGVPIGWFGPVWTGANLTVALAALLSERVRAVLGDHRMVLLFPILILAGYAGLGFGGAVGSFLFYYLLTTVRGLRGPMMLHHAQTETPSANRAGILSLQTLTFRLLFVLTGPLVGMAADRLGMAQAFRLLFAGFLILLPPLTLLFLRTLREREKPE